MLRIQNCRTSIFILLQNQIWPSPYENGVSTANNTLVTVTSLIALIFLITVKHDSLASVMGCDDFHTSDVFDQFDDCDICNVPPDGLGES